MPRARKQPAAPDVPAPVPKQDVGEVVHLDADPERGTRQAPKLMANAPFLLAYHPARWQVMEGRCVPSLGTVVLHPGVSGVQARGGRLLWRDAASAWQERGWTVSRQP
jgi:hypothetical protein